MTTEEKRKELQLICNSYWVCTSECPIVKVIDPGVGCYFKSDMVVETIYNKLHPEKGKKTALREIIFRGQTRRRGGRVKNADGEPMPSHWVYGGVFPGDGDFSVIYQREPEVKKFAVYSDTVGQFTGLLDCNKVRIFEGDIVPYEDEIGVIKYDVEDARFVIKFDGWIGNFADMAGDWVEVIGNVYDNPEIVESKR